MASCKEIKKISIPYGDGSVNIEISSERVLGILDMAEGAQIKFNGLETEFSIKKSELKDFFKSYDHVLIIVNDHDRPTPTAKVLPYIIPYLKYCKDFRFVVATGSHRAPNLKELEHIFSQEIYNKYRDKIYIHNARTSDHVYFGTTTRGTKVMFDAIIESYDGIIAINSVEPHYFAGFTGGRKSFLPGVAAYETIEHNHSFALSEDSGNIKLEGNPVHEDMMESVNMIFKHHTILGIQLTLGTGTTVTSCHIAPLHDAFFSAVADAKAMYCRPLKEEADLVITVATSPFDHTLYQAQKALENVKTATRPGGTIVLVAECADGIGSRTFYDLLASHSEPSGVIEEISKGYKLGYHKAAKIAQAAMKYNIYLLSSMGEEDIRKAHFRPITDLQNLIDSTEGKVLVVMDGNILVPYVHGR